MSILPSRRLEVLVHPEMIVTPCLSAEQSATQMRRPDSASRKSELRDDLTAKSEIGGFGGYKWLYWKRLRPWLGMTQFERAFFA